MTKPSNYKGIIGSSQRVQKLRDRIEPVANTQVPVVIFGESGVGKTLVANAIHEASNPGKNRPFVTFNCATVEKDMIDAELFGYAKGAFTGAVGNKLGKFRLADKGTLFLDEIGNMPSYTQTKILTVLDDGMVTGLGEEKPVRVSVRIISATNTSLVDAMNAGTFREDLYYRLVKWVIRIPPLRKSREEIRMVVPDLAVKIAKKVGRAGNVGGASITLSEEALEELEKHTWLGNIRELENVLTRLTLRFHNETPVTAKAIRLAIEDDERNKSLRERWSERSTHPLSDNPETFGSLPGIPGETQAEGAEVAESGAARAAEDRKDNIRMVLAGYEYQEATNLVKALNMFGSMRKAALHCYIRKDHEYAKRRMDQYGIEKGDDGKYSMDARKGERYRERTKLVVDALNQEKTVEATASYLGRTVEEIEMWIEGYQIELGRDGAWTSPATSTAQDRADHK